MLACLCFRCRSEKSTNAAATPADTELHAMMRLEGTAALVWRDLQDMTAKQVRLMLLVSAWTKGFPWHTHSRKIYIRSKTLHIM